MSRAYFYAKIKEKMTQIDGSYLEGGGQILRTALALSQILQMPCYIFNIRKNREKPGLQTQHLTFVQALKDCFGATVEGAYLNSQEIRFFPGKEKKDKIKIKIPTAGSITLILQGLLPPLIFEKTNTIIEIEGGATDTFFAPTIDYFQFCFLHFLKKLNIQTELNILKRGYYPEGGAKVYFSVFPWQREKIKEKELCFEQRKNLQKIILFSRASLFLKEKKVAERQKTSAKEILKIIKAPIEEMVDYHQTDCPGSSLFIGAVFDNVVIGSDQIGKIGKSSEEIGRETALNLLREDKEAGFFDSHLQDQIINYLFLLNKKVKIRVGKMTKHLETNLWVLTKFLRGKLKIENQFIEWQPE